MPQPLKRIYEFGPFRFYPDERVLFSQNRNVSMPGKAKDVLLVLFESRGEPVSKEDLLKAVWGRNGGEDSNLYRAITDCKKALHKFDPDREYIESIREYGYRFVADDVQEVVGEGPTPTPGGPVQLANSVIESASLSSVLVNSHPVYLHTAALLYGLLNGLMVVVEVAYKLDEYPWAVPVAILAFLWTYLTSVGILKAVQSQVAERSQATLTLAILAFIAAAFLLFLVVAQYLPATPVTEQTTQPSTAQAAYLKITLYHFILVLPFLIIPFHFIAALQAEIRNGKQLQRPRGTVYISPPALLGILLAYLLYAGISHHSLTGSLKPGPYMNLFIILLWIRLALFFGLAIFSLIWYSQTLDELRRRSLATANQLSTPSF